MPVRAKALGTHGFEGELLRRLQVFEQDTANLRDRVRVRLARVVLTRRHEPCPRIEDIRRGAPLGGKEIRPRIECRREIARAATAMRGVVEGELGERDRMLGPKLAGCERGMERSERSRRIIGPALDEICP